MNEREIAEHFKQHTERAVIRRWLEKVEFAPALSMYANFWPVIHVHPEIIRLPIHVRHDTQIAEKALKAAVPKIRQDIQKLSKVRNRQISSGFRGTKKSFEKMVARGRLITFELNPLTFQLVGGRIGVHASAFVPNQEQLDHMFNLEGHDYWYENNVGDTPLESLIMTRWILEYHKQLMKMAEAAQRKT